MTGFESRPTRDFDFMMRWLSNDTENMNKIMVEICTADTGNDFIRLDGFHPPTIYTYSLESTIAEKFDAIVKRMEATSRMKDFF